MYNLLDDQLVSGAAEYVARCQTFEGGFGGEPGNEAHGGYTFCGLAALCILGATNVIDIPALKVRRGSWACCKSTQQSGADASLSTGSCTVKWSSREGSKGVQTN